ncbi:hypothetical protein V1512DRAFT_88861 [Lipomyces arxii]|uniref:uncharacterized protein n=1 Tax=Lipomyces arxii TaxID=56418 RepID=UPI0034D01343
MQMSERMSDYLLLRPSSALDLAAIYSHVGRALDQCHEGSSHTSLPLVFVQCAMTRSSSSYSDSFCWIDHLTHIQNLLLERFPTNGQISIIPVLYEPASAQSAANTFLNDIAESIRGSLFKQQILDSTDPNAVNALSPVSPMKLEQILGCLTAGPVPLSSFETSLLCDCFVNISDLCNTLTEKSDITDHDKLSGLEVLDRQVFDDITQFWQSDFAIES